MLPAETATTYHPTRPDQIGSTIGFRRHAVTLGYFKLRPLKSGFCAKHIVVFEIQQIKAVSNSSQLKYYIMIYSVDTDLLQLTED